MYSNPDDARFFVSDRQARMLLEVEQSRLARKVRGDRVNVTSRLYDRLAHTAPRLAATRARRALFGS